MVDGEAARSVPLTIQFENLCHSMALLDPALREACRSLGVLDSYFESVVKKTPPVATMAYKMRAAHARTGVECRGER